MNGQVMNPEEDKIFLCVQDCWLLCQQFIYADSWMEMQRYHFMGIIKNGLTLSWEVFFWLWALKTIEAKKQLLPIFRALQTYRVHP